ncbi:antibiotic biosynthesis monooxygenase family protein [Streptomyces sp. NPDC005728]|uniref:antibiotic biosynthesis monooxygenase family protein n=1 Tax=Streptomyces sp. NPDC005728 TaxID=3157054 RepID=UPI0034110150
MATLINVFSVAPHRQSELIALLVHATEETMKHQPGFICANFHASQDGERVINYAQWESEEHYQAMLANPEARVHMDEAATIATDVQPRLFRVESTHTAYRAVLESRAADGLPSDPLPPTCARDGRGRAV